MDGAAVFSHVAKARLGQHVGNELPDLRELLGELARGRSSREIAKSLMLSENTVKTHVSAIMAKLGVQDRTQAALHAVRTGLLD